jgi:integrase
MRWSEINGADWTLPAGRNKTKLDLVRPLSKSALACLQRGDGEFVFGPVGSLSTYKRAFDKAVPLPRWTLHDLRRTARSLMSRAGVASDHAERCLGHVIGGVRGVYDRHEYYEEKRRAFEALAAQIDRIVNPQENVVAMAERKR